MIKRILLALAGTSYTETAIRTAIELARIHSASITAATVVDVESLSNVGPVPIGGGETAEELRKFRVEVTRERVTEAIRECESMCNLANIACDTRIEEGDPFELLVSISRFHDVTLFGLRSVFEYALSAEDVKPDTLLTQLVAHGARPILGTPKANRIVRRVLLAFGGSPASACAMRQFVQFRMWPDLQYRVVTFGSDQCSAEANLADAAEYCAAHGIQVDRRYVQGSAPKLILREIDEYDADVVVLGSSHRNLFVRKIFGETARTVIEHSDRMVFLSQ